MRFIYKIFLPLVVFLFMVIVLQGGILANTGQNNDQSTLIKYNICEEAKIVYFGFSIQEDEPLYGFHLLLEFLNTSSESERFKVTIEVSGGIVVGSYVPRSGIPPIKMDAGEIWTGKFPLPIQEIPKEIIVNIEKIDFYE